MTKDWLKVEGDENLSNAERLGFTKDQIDKFLQGMTNENMEKEKLLDDLI